MWVFFGLVTLLISIALAFWSRSEARWKATGHSWPGQRHYEQLFTEHKGVILDYRLGIRGARGFDFMLRPERWFDRLFKLLSISGEVQLGDLEFDRAWYVVSEDWLLRRALAASSRFRHDLLNLLNECSRVDVRLKRLHCQSGRLWIALKPLDGNVSDAEHRFDERARVLVPLLYQIEAHLAHLRPDRFEAVRDRYALRALLVVSVSTGFAFYAAIHLLRLEFLRTPFLVEATPLVWQAIALGTAVLTILIFASLFALGGTSRAHLVLIELLFTGSFAFVGTAFVMLRDVNMDLDTSERQVVEATIVEKEYRRRRRGPDDYYLHVSDWTGRGGTRRIEVSSDLYDRTSRGGRLEIVQRSGFLGHRWVERLAASKSTP
jgi:hypothetical protein